MDSLNPGREYELLGVDNVPRVYFATGGLLLQKLPIVCGGLNFDLDDDDDLVS